MTTYHFGSGSSSTAWVEYAAVPVTAQDSSTILVSPRPVDGDITLLARDASTQAPLDSIPVGENGYWATTTEDIPIIEVSGDGSSWVPQYGREALDSAVLGGQQVALAIEAGNAATDAVTSLSSRVTDIENTIANSGGGTLGDPYAAAPPGDLIVWPTPDKAGQLLPRPTTRLDLVVDWNLDTPPPSGGGYLIPGTDRYTDTSP